MDTYKIVRRYFDSQHKNNGKVIRTGLTREEAKRWCSREDTHEKDENGRTVWFDGFVKE